MEPFEECINNGVRPQVVIYPAKILGGVALSAALAPAV